MGLRTRIERLEAMAEKSEESLPEILVQFIPAIGDGNGPPRPGKPTDGLRLMPGGGKQWLDADMNPVITST